MPQIVKCNECSEILYQDADLCSPEEIHKHCNGKCPKCGKNLSLEPLKVNVDPSDKESVKSLQYTLKRHGYKPGDIDGDMGKGTVAAMRKAQGERDAPGILDRLTDFLKKIY